MEWISTCEKNSSDEEFDMETRKRDLQKSFSQFEKSVERKGLDISNINLLQSLEEESETNGKESWSPRLQPIPVWKGKASPNASSVCSPRPLVPLHFIAL